MSSTIQAKFITCCEATIQVNLKNFVSNMKIVDSIFRVLFMGWTLLILFSKLLKFSICLNYVLFLKQQEIQRLETYEIKYLVVRDKIKGRKQLLSISTQRL